MACTFGRTEACFVVILFYKTVFVALSSILLTLASMGDLVKYYDATVADWLGFSTFFQF